jgi:hypothetical protein
MVHHHPCQMCGAKTECSGELEENYDGEPPIICVEFHLPNGETDLDFRCETCEAKYWLDTNPSDEWAV